MASKTKSNANVGRISFGAKRTGKAKKKLLFFVEKSLGGK